MLLFLLQDDVYEWYNLAEDIGETNNLVKEYLGILTEIQNILQTARTENKYSEWVAKN